MPLNVDRSASYYLERTEKTRLGKSYRAAKKAHPRKSGFHLMTNGLEALAARAALCDLAERGLDLQYYIYENDNTGKFLYQRLLAAADRGVRVRILLDDMTTVGNNGILSALDQHPNIEIRIFNPFNRDEPRALQYITRFGSVTKRMHNKAFVADNQAAIVGGRNIGDRYFDADPNVSFRDIDLLGIGPVVEGISKSFDLYWNSELSYPIDVLDQAKPSEINLDGLRKDLDDTVRTGSSPEFLSALRKSPLAGQIRSNAVPFEWGAAEVFFDHPAKIGAPADARRLYLTPQLQPYFDQLGSELIIVSPYFVPGDDGVSFLADLVKRGSEGAGPHQLADVHRRIARLCRVRQISKKSSAGRRRTVRDPPTGRSTQRKPDVRLLSGQPPRQDLHLRPETNLHRVAEFRLTVFLSQYGNRRHL